MEITVDPGDKFSNFQPFQRLSINGKPFRLASMDYIIRIAASRGSR